MLIIRCLFSHPLCRREARAMLVMFFNKYVFAVSVAQQDHNLRLMRIQTLAYMLLHVCARCQRQRNTPHVQTSVSFVAVPCSGVHGPTVLSKHLLQDD